MIAFPVWNSPTPTPMLLFIRKRLRTTLSPMRTISAPLRCGVEVKEVHRNDGRRGFRVKTSDGEIEANNVVAATGAFQCPIMPALVPGNAGLMQIHSKAYKSPDQLPPGPVLIVRRVPLRCRSRKNSRFWQARLPVGRAP